WPRSRFRPTSPLLPASRRCSPSTQRIPVQPRPSPLPSKSSLLCRPGCPPRAPCNCPCTKSSASRSRRGVPCSAYCFRRTSNSGDRGTCRETGERIAEITGAPVPVRSIEEVLQQAAEDFDAFYVERTPPTSTGTGSILVAAVDGKGIPMIKPEGGQRAVRLTKGQKAN